MSGCAKGHRDGKAAPNYSNGLLSCRNSHVNIHFDGIVRITWRMAVCVQHANVINATKDKIREAALARS